MKHLLLSLLIPCSIITASQEQIVLEHYDIKREGDKITMSSWVWETEGLYSVEKNMNDGTWFMGRMMSVYNSTDGTEESTLQQMNYEDEPEVFAAFRKKINAFQRSEEALEKEKARSAKKPTLKRRNTLKALFLRK